MTGDNTAMLFSQGARLGRYRQVTKILARHGFGAALSRFGIGGPLPFPRRLLGLANGEASGSNARRLRLAFEELGVTFIKLGQVLSTRADLLPDEYTEELARLQDAVPAVDADAVRAIVEAQLGGSIDELFASFDDTPLASASIGQVHAATLHDGDEVVVKVQKPGVARRIETDLAVLRQLAEAAERRSLTARRFDVVSLVDEFAWQLRAELDYEREARNARRFADQFAGDPAVQIPGVYWSHTTRSVLTMERVGGISLGDTKALRAAGVDCHTVVQTSARLVLESVFRHGFYHADPHPGNYFVQPDASLAVVDFGMVGQIPENTRFALVRLLEATVHRKAETMADALADLDMYPRPDVRKSFVRDLQHVLDAYYGLQLSDISATRLHEDLTTVARRNEMPIPAELGLLLKTMAMNEGVGRALDPEFNFLEIAEPFATEAMREMRSPVAMARRAVHSTAESTFLAAELPELARRIVRQAERGDLEVRLRHEEIDRAVDGFAAVVNRLAAAIIGSSVTVAVSIVMLAYRPPAWRVVAAGFLAGAPFVVGSLWSWAMLSARRRNG